MSILKIKVIVLIIFCLNISCTKKPEITNENNILNKKSAVLIVGNNEIEWQRRGIHKARKMLEKFKIKIKAFLNCKGQGELILPTIKKAVKLKPDVILIFQSSKIASKLMKNANKLKFINVPIIMANMFGKKRFHPMITGLSFIAGVKPIFKIWKKILPKAKKVAILASANPFSQYLVKLYEKYSKKFGYKIVGKYIPEYGYQWKEAVLRINKSDADFVLIGFWVNLKMRNGKIHTNIEYDNLKYWTVRNIKKGYASFFDSVVLSGLTFGVCNDLVMVGGEIAEIALTVLRGKDVKRISISNPKFRFISINMKHANIVGLKIPYDILSNAKYIHKKFIGEYNDQYFKERTGGIIQPRRPINWEWIPK